MTTEPIWNYENGTEVFTSDQMRGLVDSGIITASTLVWKTGMLKRFRADRVRGLLKGAYQNPESIIVSELSGADVIAATSGKDEAQRQAFAAPIDDVRPLETSETDDAVFAGFSVRMVAFFVDNFILLIGSSLLGFLLKAPGLPPPAQIMKLLVLCYILPWMLWWPLFEAVRGATPGKMLFGLRLIDENGARPTLNKLVLRHMMRVGMLLLPVLAILDHVMILFTKSRQPLHDLFSGVFCISVLRGGSAINRDDL